MINPPAPPEKQTVATRIQHAAASTSRVVRRERDLVIALLFLIIGFIFGKF